MQRDCECLLLWVFLTFRDKTVAQASVFKHKREASVASFFVGVPAKQFAFMFYTKNQQQKNNVCSQSPGGQRMFNMKSQALKLCWDGSETQIMSVNNL